MLPYLLINLINSAEEMSSKVNASSCITIAKHDENFLLFSIWDKEFVEYIQMKNQTDGHFTCIALFNIECSDDQFEMLSSSDKITLIIEKIKKGRSYNFDPLPTIFSLKEKGCLNFKYSRSSKPSQYFKNYNYIIFIIGGNIYGVYRFNYIGCSYILIEKKYIFSE